MNRIAATAFILCICFSATVLSADLRIPQDFPDLKSAFAISSSGDRIIFDTGVFSGSGFANVAVPPGRSLQITSVTGSSRTNIIGNSGSSFLIYDNQSGINAPLQIDGLTITGFSTGIVISWAEVEIRRCSFINNDAAVTGPGVDLPWWALIDSCIFDQNGYGVRTNGWTQLRLLRSAFTNGGEGVYWVCVEVGELSNCCFHNNLNAIVLRSLCSQIKNNDVSRNWIGIAATGEYMHQSELVSLFRNNNVWGNFDADYWNCDAMTGIACNISRDPAHCAQSTADHYIASISPLLAANNSCGATIGWFEGIACYCGDVDVSGNVDISDITAIISYLYLNGPPPDPLAAGEIDGQAPIDIADLSRLIDYLYISFAPLPCGT